MKTYTLTITIKTEEAVKLTQSGKYEIADTISSELGLQGKFEVKGMTLKQEEPKK